MSSSFSGPLLKSCRSAQRTLLPSADKTRRDLRCARRRGRAGWPCCLQQGLRSNRRFVVLSSDGFPEDRSITTSCACGTQRLQATWATHFSRVVRLRSNRRLMAAASISIRPLCRSFLCHPRLTTDAYARSTHVPLGFRFFPAFGAVQHFAGLSTVVVADDTVFCHPVDHPRRSTVTDSQAALQQ